MILYHIFISYIVLKYSMLNGLYGSIIYQTISNYLISCWDVHILYTYFKLYMICARFKRYILQVYVMWLRVFLLSRCNYICLSMAVKSYSPTTYVQLQEALIYPSHEYHEWVRFWLRFQAAPLLGRVPRPAPQLGAQSGTSRLSRPKTWVQMYGAFDVRTFRDAKFESHGHRRVFKVFRCEISKLKNCLFRQVRNDTNTLMLIFATPLKAMEKGKGDQLSQETWCLWKNGHQIFGGFQVRHKDTVQKGKAAERQRYW